jgi:ATP adenylyltransferase
MSLERLWAGWRSEYVGSAGAGTEGECVLCRVVGDDDSVVWRGETVAVILNAFPYTSGHLMVLPVRHVGELEDLTGDESAELWATVTDAVRALKEAYRPEGINLGVNLGRAAGAGVPGHCHVHGLPRWTGDTNFTTAVAETRVLPEALPATMKKLRAAWPKGASAP